MYLYGMESGMRVGCVGGGEGFTGTIGAMLCDKSTVFQAAGLWGGRSMGTGGKSGGICRAFGGVVPKCPEGVVRQGNGLDGTGRLVCFG